ncbi:MAG: ATP synthase subunit C [Clostridiales bacterium]|nr:ATP synthase subunit C [Clostridiales bacterium]
MYLTILAIFAMVAPVVYSKIKPVSTKKRAQKILFAGITSFFGVIAVMAIVSMTGSPAIAADAAAAGATAAPTGIAAGLAFIGAGLVTTGSCIGSGIAVASASTAALGSISEDGSLFGKALIFVALAEAISLYGVLISILILNKI